MNTKTVIHVMLSVGVSLLTTVLAREFLWYDTIVDDMSSWGVFFSVFGVVYAIIAGFLLVEVLQRYGNLSGTIEEEVNSLQDIRDFLLYIDTKDKKTKANILDAIEGYGNSVIGKEWKEMSDVSKPTDSDTSPELIGLIVATNGINVKNESDIAALTAIIGEISKITTLRTKRINLADAELPPRLKILLFFMSMTLVAGFIMLAVANVWIHLFMVASVVTSIHLMYTIINDLDQPFEGVWNLSNYHFVQFLSNLRK